MIFDRVKESKKPFTASTSAIVSLTAVNIAIVHASHPVFSPLYVPFSGFAR